ncbi:hypothetical protein Tcan_08786 [Toxocara canis]|uniref:Uncharacterized protein n=1 Tax=Toxocara canis TaxID=6265 RepID=A0A0B2V0I6_TOXCA|nr:hypothetical protein Tcan_08786 [Toxocara canis]
MSTSSSDEFEDAEDGLGPLPDVTHSAGSPFTTVSSPHRANATMLYAPRGLNEAIERRVELGVPQPSTSLHASVMSSPTPISPQLGKAETSSASRRGRLNILRGRMRSEFGGTGLGGNTLGGGSVEDETGSASESASLASWGRNLLMEHSALTVGPFFPADSISTKAFSTNTNTPEHAHPLGLLTNESAPQLQSRASESNLSPTSPPPPREPPPPLPLSSCPPCVNRVQIPAPKAVPPPLPPRNPALRLPAALPPQQIASIVSERSESTSSAVNSYPRRRGHVKTNSLDRGLSLAKSMKTGPFPPPANKSNSLKRECSADGTDMNSFLSLDGGEEDLRNSDAQGIIHQITASILNDEPLREESSSSDSPYRASHNGRLSAVGEEQISTTTASVSASPSSLKTESKLEKPITTSPEQPIKNEMEKLNSSALSVDNKEDESTKDTTLTRETAKDDVTSVPSHDMQSMPSQAFIDPITRDVERRMSMKGHQQTSRGDEGEGAASQALSSAGGIERAATLVREYGIYASGLFRGAIWKCGEEESEGGVLFRCIR